MEGSKIFRALFIILIAITSATIFYFSSENGEISGNTSGKVIKKILAKFPEYQKLSDKRKAQITAICEKNGTFYYLYTIRI